MKKRNILKYTMGLPIVLLFSVILTLWYSSGAILLLLINLVVDDFDGAPEEAMRTLWEDLGNIWKPF